MNSDEIRETFLEFYASRDHRRLPSAPIVPTTFDPSTLFIIAGMQPLKSYFLGLEQPPHNRLVSCQKVFRTADIEIIGTTHRHLTFFEMLGNFSVGDYFKQGAVESAWELSLEGFGFDPERPVGDGVRGRRRARPRPGRGGDRRLGVRGRPA